MEIKENPNYEVKKSLKKSGLIVVFGAIVELILQLLPFVEGYGEATVTITISLAAIRFVQDFLKHKYNITIKYEGESINVKIRR